MSYLRGNKGQLAVIVVLGGLLFTLAVFQYIWLGQLSERERERMGRTLAFATRAVRWGFDGELADIYKNFQVDFREEESFAEQIAARYAERIDMIEGPDILESIYWVNLDEDTGLVIQQYTGAGLAILDEWPVDLAYLVEQFEGELPKNDVQFDLPVGPAPLQDRVPALVIQQVITRPRDSLREHRSISWMIATLNREVILGELIPQLSDEYVYGEEALDYNVAIREIANPENLIYTSDPSLTAANFSDPDATRSMYALRFGSFNQRSYIERHAWGVVEERVDPKWSLVVKHQAGSLEAAVRAARNRSLAMSIGVMALLGGAIGMIVVSTRRAQRLAAQQMEFVAGVSHELRTPLAVIRAAGENLADDVVHDAERTRQYGQLIDREGRRLSDMVERVLLFAKIRSGNQQFQYIPVDLGAIVTDAIAANSALLEEHSVTAKSSGLEALPRAMGDPAALNSAVQNLLSNAIKYSDRGGVITVEARRAHTRHGAEIQIVVSDKGDGIPAAELPRVFDPFFRGKQPRQAQIQGSGLGLSLVRQVVEAHGGQVTVESSPGSGSTFALHIPTGDIPALED